MGNYVMDKGLNDERQQISTFMSILHSKFMKVFLMSGNLLYSVLLFSGLIIGVLYGYSMIEHSMSLLGSVSTTPLPLLFNLSCIFSGFLLVPLVLILEKHLVSDQYPKACKIINKFGLIIGIMAAIGVIFVGVFSMDISQVLHNVATGFAFGGLIATVAFFGVSLILYQSTKTKMVGFFGLIIPGIMLFGWWFFQRAIFEWMMLFSVLIFLIPMAFHTSLHISR